MGYYNQNSPPNRNQKRNRYSIYSILIGILIGVVLVTIFWQADLLPNAWTNQTNKEYDSRGSQANSADYSQINVDVTTQITDVIDQVAPAVVSVINIQQRSDFWQSESQEAGTGSGVIYKQADGYAYVVTNHHVVSGADAIEVVLSNETRVDADVIGSDLFSDLAVLRMDDEHIEQTIDIGTSENVKVGEPAVAIGNPLGMFAGSVTQGVISGKQRTIPQDFNNDGRADWQAEVIQTDAAINPGNSGGALINIDGRLIGINSMKVNESAVEGIGFAIPIDTALPIIQELEGTGEVKRPYLGLEIYSLEEVPQTEWSHTLHLPNEVTGGVYVWSVEPLSPADQAGLERLDVITELDGTEVMDMIDLRKILYQEKAIGEQVDVTFYRDGQRQTITLELGAQ